MSKWIRMLSFQSTPNHPQPFMIGYLGFCYLLFPPVCVKHEPGWLVAVCRNSCGLVQAGAGWVTLGRWIIITFSCSTLMDGDLLELKTKVCKVPREGPYFSQLKAPTSTSAFTIKNSLCYAMIIESLLTKPYDLWVVIQILLLLTFFRRPLAQSNNRF